MSALSMCDVPRTSPPSVGGRGVAAAGLLLAALVAGMGILIRPIGEFPLNDDWAYARVVEHWLETGGPHFTGWTSVPLIAQAFWGMLFCLPHGFSFAALRLSTAVAGLLGVWGMFFLMRSVGRDRPTAFAAALVLAVNPLYVNLSHTFMTDVPFTAASFWALAGFIRAFSDGRRRWIWLGVICSLVAALIRHPGFLMPVAFWGASLLGPRNSVRRHTWWPGVGVVLAVAIFCAFATARMGLRPFWTSQGNELVAGLGAVGGSVRMLERAGEILVYLGLFGLPFGLFSLSGKDRRRTAMHMAWIVPLAALTVFFLSEKGVRMPLAGNVLYNAGLGPVRLYDVTTRGLPSGMTVSAGLWMLITGLGVAGALQGAVRWFAGWKTPAETNVAARRARWLLGLCAVGWVAPMLVAGYFDRYLLILLPPWLVVLAPAVGDSVPRSRGWLAGALALALLYAGFSVAATHDYFSWNRARWTALDEWVNARHVSPDQMDGGFEFNGWYRYDPDQPADREPPADRSWWWVADDEFVIALGPVPGYAEVARHPFSRWLGKSPGAIRVLQREEPSP